MINNKLISLIKSKKGVILLVLGLLIGLLLVISDSKSQTNNKDPSNMVYSVDEYTHSLESKLENLINQINGVSNTKVMITLKSGNEIIYAEDGSLNGEKTLLVNGNPLYVKEYMPEIEGVAIVCGGGSDAVIAEKITQLVCSVLGLYSTHVYVTE